MSKRQTIDAFFKKKDISHSKLKTSVETNVDTSMPNKHPSKCPRSRKQIYEFTVNE